MVAGNDSKPIPRHELIAAALELGIERPESMTEGELKAKIQQISEGQSSEGQSSERPPGAGGWFSVARHLVASVMEQGLNMPIAARVIRDSVRPRSFPPGRPPVPTVTLAQIYISQGHPDRALATLREVVLRDPYNTKAQRLLGELEDARRDEERVRRQSEPISSGPSSVPDSSEVIASRGAVEPASVESAAPPAPAHVSAGEAADSAESGTEQAVSSGESGAPLVYNEVSDAVLEPADGAAAASNSSPANDGAPLISEEVAALLDVDADALVLLREAGRAIAYWELGPQSIKRLDSGASFELHVCVATPSHKGARMQEQQFSIRQAAGTVSLDVEQDSVVRAVLVRRRGEAWLPLAVASTHRTLTNGQGWALEFRPRKSKADMEVVHRAQQRISVAM